MAEMTIKFTLTLKVILNVVNLLIKVYSFNQQTVAYESERTDVEWEK